MRYNFPFTPINAAANNHSVIKNPHAILAVAALAATAVCSHAQNVTFTGTASSTGHGYVSGETYTVSFVISEEWESGDFNNGVATAYQWKKSSPEHDSLFSAIGGSGVSGAYLDDAALIQVNSPSGTGMTIFQAGGEMMFDLSPIGLLTPGGDSIVALHTYVTSGISHTLTGAPTDLNDYFAFSGLNGDYAVNGSLTIYIEDLMGPGMPASVNLDLTNANFSAIPEPSTYAAILGVGALGLGFWRRRKAQKDRTLPLDTEA